MRDRRCFPYEGCGGQGWHNDATDDGSGRQVYCDCPAGPELQERDRQERVDAAASRQIATLEAENAALRELGRVATEAENAMLRGFVQRVFDSSNPMTKQARKILDKTSGKALTTIHRLQHAAAAMTHPNPAKPEAELVAELDAAREANEAVFGTGGEDR